MLSALIVEDENKICQLIVRLADWNALGIQLIGSCDNGISALEKIELERPDIIITDIRMPGMNGLDLIKAVREKEIPCEFIIISGYKQFDYAKSAIQYGVSEYLLKPINKEELENALRQAAGKCKNADITQPTGNKRIWKLRQDLRNSFMERLMDPSASIDLSAGLLNKQYHFKFNADAAFRMIYLGFCEPLSKRLIRRIPDIVEDIRAILDPVCEEMVPFVQDNNRIFFLLNYKKEKNIEKELDSVMKIFDYYVSEFGEGISAYSSGLSNEGTDIRQLRPLINSARDASLCGLLREHNKMYCCDLLIYDNMTAENIVTAEELSQLRIAAECLDARNVTAILKKAFFRINSRSDPTTVINALKGTAATFLTALNGAEHTSDTIKINDLCRKATVQRTIASFVECIISWAQEQMDAFLIERKTSGSRPVYLAKQYIAENYMENITLKSVADRVHLNASYFSIIFKKETGQTFSDYLLEQRMKKAKRLICESNMNISEVSEAVGYADSKYFSRKFTEYVGVKPSKYRVLRG
ncbi:MAG: response regulator transcription factor [Lachnospiraceae bacterium]